MTLTHEQAITQAWDWLTTNMPSDDDSCFYLSSPEVQSLAKQFMFISESASKPLLSTDDFRVTAELLQGSMLKPQDDAAWLAVTAKGDFVPNTQAEFMRTFEPNEKFQDLLDAAKGWLKANVETGDDSLDTTAYNLALQFNDYYDAGCQAEADRRNQ